MVGKDPDTEAVLQAMRALGVGFAYARTNDPSSFSVVHGKR